MAITKIQCRRGLVEVELTGNPISPYVCHCDYLAPRRLSNTHPRRQPLRTVIAAALVLLSLAGCGQSGDTTAAAPIGTKPDVIVTLDGPHHTCLVALSSETQSSSISCDELVSFMRDELRLTGGAVYELHTIPSVDQAQLAKVKANLKDAGYRHGGGRP